MELISKISKGSRMDQIYIPKNRIGFGTGSYVVVKLLQEKKIIYKPFFYGVQNLEPLKLSMVEEIFANIDSNVESDNIIITGSFLDKGFCFNDIDVLLISEKDIDKKHLEELLKKEIGIKVHIILMNNSTLIKGLNTDPLYQMMLSRCIARRRFVYRPRPKINYKILDVHLLKSKLLIDNFDYLNGNEKYEMVRNAVAIALFVDSKEVSKEKVDSNIDRIFGKEMSIKIRKNVISEKTSFLEKYKKFYKDLSSRIIESGAKQK